MILKNNLPLLSCRSLSKKFCRRLKTGMLYGMGDILKNSLGIKSREKKLREHEFWALDNINFELEKGGILGVIGNNGCGKTTLLRMLAGIYPPDRGEIVIRGKTSAMLNIGAGFHSLMSVKENVYITGIIQGMKKREIGKKLNMILSESGLRKFADSPAGILSSGMRLRLAFMTALSVDTDLFLVDEIINTADEIFRKKSREMIKKKANNSGIVIVSHNLDMISDLCTEILVLEKGKAVFRDSHVSRGIAFHKNRKAVTEEPGDITDSPAKIPFY